MFEDFGDDEGGGGGDAGDFSGGSFGDAGGADFGGSVTDDAGGGWFDSLTSFLGGAAKGLLAGGNATTGIPGIAPYGVNPNANGGAARYATSPYQTTPLPYAAPALTRPAYSSGLSLSPTVLIIGAVLLLLTLER